MMCDGVGKSGSPTSRWMASGSSQARSMISRMRETGMELAIVEGRAGSWPILVSCGRNETPLFSHPHHPRPRPIENKGSGKPEHQKSSVEGRRAWYQVAVKGTAFLSCYPWIPAFAGMTEE